MEKSPLSSKWESLYLDKTDKFKDELITCNEDALQEGFEYFGCEEYRNEKLNGKSAFMEKFKGGFKNNLRLMKIFAKNVLSIRREITKSYKDLEKYLEELEKTGEIYNNDTNLSNYPNEQLWQDLKDYAWKKRKIILGFTQLPSELIFKGKTVLYKYAIVCIQEMDREKIDKAPDFEAGEEVMKIYNSLGKGVNDIADWLRRNHKIKCQSNHPLGGLVNTVPLAAKAGMGGFGHNGLLITPEFGQRQRIAPIFIQNKLFEFTDNSDHRWIENFCKNCGKCERSCPVGAIYNKGIKTFDNVVGIGETRTCIDREKCFPQFNKTLGCSICISVCPFSKGNGIYEKLKNVQYSKNGC